MKRGFTLIEMLVVVVIIGILAAIAMPMYEKSVWKARNAQLKSAVVSVAQVQKAYMMANDEMATAFGQLDLTYDLEAPTSSAGINNTCSLLTAGKDAIRAGEDFQIILNNRSAASGAIIAVWTRGKYKCNGFIWAPLKDDQLMCLEARNGTSKIQSGEFCEQLEAASKSSYVGGWDWYKLP